MLCMPAQFATLVQLKVVLDQDLEVVTLKAHADKCRLPSAEVGQQYLACTPCYPLEGARSSVPRS